MSVNYYCCLELECDDCGAASRLTSGDIEVEDYLRKKAKDKGWSFDGNECFCPSCTEAMERTLRLGRKTKPVDDSINNDYDQPSAK